MIRALHYATGKPVAVRFRGGRVGSVSGARLKRAPFVGPGLVDLQVNGFRGLDFNTPPLAPETVGRVTRELWKEGVTAYLPTVITNAPATIGDLLRAIAQGCEEDDAAAAGVAGIHLEGPFISPEDGVRGAHDRAHVRAPDWDLFRRWQDAAAGRIRILTLSPEWPGSAAFIEKCAASGVIVSLGHTAASPEQVREAVAAGARMSTHLGNGSHAMLPRHRSYLWEQLAADALDACFIGDGFHLPEAVLKVGLRAKGKRAALVSDAVYLAGMPPGDYDTHIGGRVTLTPEGRLHLASDPGILAGSAQSILHGVAHLVRSGLAPLREAWELASVRPAKRIGLRSGLRAGAPGDLAVFAEREGGLRVVETWKHGRRVHAA